MSLILTLGTRTRQVFVRARRRYGWQGEQSAEEGAGSVFTAAQVLRSNRLKKPLVVLGADAEVWRERVIHALEESNLEYALFDGLPVRPTAEDGEAVALSWIREVCDSFLVLGDWHVMDLVKAAAARTANHSHNILALAGRGGIRRKRLPPVLTVPTTPGSGAEAVNWACVTDGEGNLFVLDDPALAPPFCILDPELLESSARPLLAQSLENGICLAVEAYLSGYADELARHAASSALRGFLENAEACWNSGGTETQRLALLRASRLAGEAASIAGCGYIRALCRGAMRVCGGEYGDICAGILPAVLEKYGNSAVDKLASLAEQSGASAEERSKIQKAAALIARLRQLGFRIGLPDLAESIGPDSFLEIADLAAAEANPWFASPTVWSADDLASVLKAAYEG